MKEFKKTCKVAWGLAESTWKRHVRNAKRLIEFLGDEHPLTASKMDLLEFLEEFDISDSYKTVRVIYGRFYDTDLASNIKVPQPESRPKNIPSKDKLRETFDNLKKLDYKTAFLMYASSGIRRSELTSLTEEDVDFEKRMLMPRGRSTKKTWVSFYNSEAEGLLEELGHLPDSHPDTYTQKFHQASDGKITPQTLREWFAEEMGKLGVSDRYIDAFCGRVPKSVLANNYTDYSAEKLREIYEKAELKALN